MPSSLIDEATQRELDRLVSRVLRDAGFRGPPVDIEVVLEALKLDRDFYDLEDPGLLRRLGHRILVGAKRVADFVEKVRLQALLFFDDKRVLLDKDLPKLKHDWASAHEVGHELIPWHREFCRGDTLETLDPAWHEQLEAEANYAASGLLFCGEVFSNDARDTQPCWKSIELLRRRYRKNWVPTARRYVEKGPDHPMLLLVSTASWNPRPADQPGRVRHFVSSPSFETRFPDPDPEALRQAVDGNTQKRRGGPVGQFNWRLLDRNEEPHVFHAECFYNTYYIITLFVLQGRAALSLDRMNQAATA